MDPADFYTGVVAEVYGALRSTTFSSDRYREFVTTHGEPALELGCGDDGPFYELAKTIDVDGVDSSADMVRRGRERLRRTGGSATIHRQRMEALSLDRIYASIYLAGPTFNLIADDETAEQALHHIADHLSHDGAALIPLGIPQPTPTQEFGLVRSAALETGEARFTVVGEDFDARSRTRTTHTRYELVTAGETVVSERDWIIHWYERSDFTRMAERAGLAVTFNAVNSREFDALVRHSGAQKQLLDEGHQRPTLG